MQTEQALQVGTGHASYNTDYHERDPPPYPGFSRPLFQPGLRKSYSGSEASTDYSLSSCENLSTSVRQEPQGEETTATGGGLLEGGRECGGGGGGHQDMLMRLGLAAPNTTSAAATTIAAQHIQGSEVKGAGTQYYITGGHNMSSPIDTPACSGVNTGVTMMPEQTANANGRTYGEVLEHLTKQMNANNNNNNNNNSANNNINNNNGTATGCYPAVNNQSLPYSISPQTKTALPILQKAVAQASTSPNTSPTPGGIIKNPSPLKGPSPIPQNMVGQQHYGSPGTSTPGSYSAPGTPSIGHHQMCTPPMTYNPVVKGTTTKPDTSPLVLSSSAKMSGVNLPFQDTNFDTSKTSMALSNVTTVLNADERKSPYPQSQTPAMRYPMGLNLVDAALSSSDESPTQEVNQSLAQFMAALTRSSGSSGSSRHRRPSTAPSARHLPSVPTPPPDYPGYKLSHTDKQGLVTGTHNKDSQTSYNIWSQPDLTRLAELKALQQQQQQQRQHQQLENTPSLLPSGDHSQKQAQVTPSVEHGSHTTSYSDSGATNSQVERSGAVQAMSTSSSTSSLTQYQQQYALTHGLPTDGAANVQALSPDSAALGQGVLPDPHHLPLFPGPGQTSSPSPVTCGDFGLVDPTVTDVSTLTNQDQMLTHGLFDTDRQLSVVTQSHAAVATRATKMVEQLSEENCLLRQELEGYANKVFRLQKLESELQKVHENYETLEKHTQKQENLEKIIRYKLTTEIKQLRESNKDLKDHLDKALRQVQQKEAYSLLDSELKNELLGKDSLIAQLITQNRDLTLPKEQLEAEVTTQRSAIKEQQVHITMLENLITTMRSDMGRLKEELRKRNAEDDKISELQKALTQLQAAVERRETIEQKLRQKLEEEVQYLRRQQGVNKVTEADEGISSDSESPTSLQSLVRQIQEKEQRLLALEAEAAKWKQKYLEEVALRQFAVDAASVPKDARIAALEQNSLETERIIAEARNERLQHMDEVHLTNRKCAELENKVKMLQAQLAEKDAMIKVLQRHTPHSHSSSLGSLLGSPIHSPRPSYASPHSSAQTSPLSSHDISAAASNVSSRQNSQLDTGFNSEGASSKENDQEGKTSLHTKSNSEGTSTTDSSNNGSPLTDAQLRELRRRLNSQVWDISYTA